MTPDEFVEDLWAYARTIPMGEHPWFKGIIEHRWSREQIIQGEVQHYLRIRGNAIFFSHIAIKAAEEQDQELLQVLLENIIEELSGERSHTDIALQFLEEGAITRDVADRAEAAPGTLACIEMINGFCARHSAIEGMAALAFTEAQQGGPGGVAERVYAELRGHYGFSERAAENYKVHAAEDVGHGGRQIDQVRERATSPEWQAKLRHAVIVGLNAFTLEWDGHVQAMTGRRTWWEGAGPLRLNLPEVRFGS
ncbi:MAG: iron-containing redox enzyme family protein [Chloroflexi bacterium]|nr:iron-containing redox enzyme family protein [Chloroflexota bacterium]